jgi:hypothetical protein
VLNIRQAKSLRGKLDLPPSPDLFLLSAISTICAGRKAVITPVNDTPLIKLWAEALKGMASFEFSENSCTITPLSAQDSSAFVALPFDILPYRDLISFILLGMGKTVALRSASHKRLENWQQRARKFGFTLDISQFDENEALSLSNAPDTLSTSVSVEEEDISPLLGLFMGMLRSCSFQIDFQFSNPLKQLAQAFGFEVLIKSAVQKETDPIARRMRMMQKKKRESTGQQFTVIADFSKKPLSDDPVFIALPGDEVLSSIMTAGKCLFPKGSFVVNNMPLESWATPVIAFIRKMGAKISVQETSRTSFGSAGMLTIQKCDLVGRKVECCPSSLFSSHLPSMVVLAAFAEGQSVFRDLEDLRNDQPDGIELLEKCIRLLGARLGEMPDGIVMEGTRNFDGFDLTENLPSHFSGSLAIAGSKCVGTTTINDELLKQRWPAFESILSESLEFRT